MKLNKSYLIEEEQQIISPDQEKFFANSKVRDTNGNLMICYHGTDIEGIKEFKPGEGGIIWFTPEKWYAGVHAEKRGGAGTIYNAFLNITKLLFIDNIDASAVGGRYNPRVRVLAGKLNITSDKLISIVDGEPEFMYDITNAKGFADLLKKAGYDGVEAIEGFSSRAFGVINPNQVKYVDNEHPTASNRMDESDVLYEDSRRQLNNFDRVNRKLREDNNLKNKFYEVASKYASTDPDRSCFISPSGEFINFDSPTNAIYDISRVVGFPEGVNYSNIPDDEYDDFIEKI